MATLRQYLAGTNVPMTLPGIDFRPLQAGLLPGKALEAAGEKINQDMLNLYDKEKAISEEKRKAAMTVSALDRFTKISMAVDDAESELKKSNVPSDAYMGSWVSIYSKTVNPHLKAIQDPEEMALVMRHLNPFQAQRYAQARGHSDRLWGAELEAKTENSTQWLENEARRDGEAGKPVDWIEGYLEQNRLNIQSAGSAYAPDKAVELEKKGRERIVKSYLRSRSEDDPVAFVTDSIRGRDNKLRGMVSSDDYWQAVNRANTVIEQARDRVEKRYRKNSEDTSKSLRLKIISGEEVSPQLLVELGPVMTDSDIGQIDALRRTYDDYNSQDVKTDRNVYDTLYGRIIRDEMSDEKALVPFAGKLSKPDFSHLYSTIMQRQGERDKEDKPRGKLIKAGRNYISRIFAASNTDIDYDRMVNQVGAEAMVMYEETMARDKDGQLDPMDVSRDVSAKFGRVAQGRIKFGTEKFGPLLQYTTEAQIEEAYRSGKIPLATRNSQLRILNRMRVLANQLEEDKKGKK